MKAIFSRVLMAIAMLFVVLAVAFAQGVPINGEVKKIDEAQGKITLMHEPITNLDMDSMTMVFRVKDPTMLKAVSVGDRVIFEADRVNGVLTVTSIKRSDP